MRYREMTIMIPGPTKAGTCRRTCPIIAHCYRKRRRAIKAPTIAPYHNYAVPHDVPGPGCKWHVEAPDVES
jgi:hypothetical protein